VVRQPDDAALAQHLVDRAFDRLARRFVDDTEDLFDGPAYGFAARPAGQRFGYGIDEGKALVCVRSDHRVADAAQRDGQQPAALTERGGILFDATAGGVKRFALGGDDAAYVQEGEQADDRASVTQMQ
jgi:hypothetical protein